MIGQLCLCQISKLNDTKTYCSNVLCEKHAIDWNKSYLGGVLETKQWRKWNTRNEMKLKIMKTKWETYLQLQHWGTRNNKLYSICKQNC